MPSIGNQGVYSENIIHIAALRFRVIGTGDLDLSLHTLQNVKTKLLVPLSMSMITDKQPTKITNFISQRIYLRLGTNSLNEYFRINRIIIFTKTVYTSYPQ